MTFGSLAFRLAPYRDGKALISANNFGAWLPVNVRPAVDGSVPGR
jgi:hypothetical protein